MSSAVVSLARTQPDRVVVVAHSRVRAGSAPGPGRQAAEDERPEAERVADADDAPLVEDDERERAVDSRQDPDERVDRVGGRFVREEGGQELRVGRGRQPASAAAQLAQQLAGVHEVAVVANRERPARAEPERRLGVLPDRRAGRRVAAVGDREVARNDGIRRSSRTELIIPRSL
jgi:hypothetical protein